MNIFVTFDGINSTYNNSFKLDDMSESLGTNIQIFYWSLRISCMYMF